MLKCISVCMPFLGLIAPNAMPMTVTPQFSDAPVAFDAMIQNFMRNAGKEGDRRVRDIQDEIMGFRGFQDIDKSARTNVDSGLKTVEIVVPVVEETQPEVVEIRQEVVDIQPEVVEIQPEVVEIQPEVVEIQPVDEIVSENRRVVQREVIKRSNRLLPKAAQRATMSPIEEDDSIILREKTTPILGNLNKPIRASSYSAVEIHGFFGLIDDGSDTCGRMLVVHVPKWVRGYFMDIKQGDVIHVYSIDGKAGGRLNVLATGRHKYYAPGRRVTTCTICVPEEQWFPLL